jgi:hypothetical protein
VQYFGRQKSDGATAFDVVVKTDEVQDAYDPFELLAGHEILGQMQPVAIIQNLTNDIQGPTGVNFVSQDFQFQARLLIRNRVTDRYVYNRFARISDFCLKLPENSTNPNCGNDPFYLARWSDVELSNGIYTATPKDVNSEAYQAINGIPPYGFVQVKFPRFMPNEAIDNQIGLMRLTAVTEPTDPNTYALIGDDWPFDDSSSTDIWVVKRLKEFRSNADFNFTNELGAVPNVLQWVYAKFNTTTSSLQVVGSQSSTSLNPLPPLGVTRSLNDNVTYSLNSPMFKMYWRNVENKPLGSKITSHPIDMRTQNGSVITFAVQRCAADIQVQRGFSDVTLYGPEARVVFMGGYDNINTNARTTGKIDKMHNDTIARDADFDYIAIEYLKPSADGIKNITMTGGGTAETNKNNNYNDGANNNNGYWRYHPYWTNGGIASTPAVVQNAPALAVYGGGGYFVGFAYISNRSSNKGKYYPANWNGGVPNANTTNDICGGGGLVLYSGTTIGLPQDSFYTATYPQVQNSSQRPVNLKPVAGLMFNPYDVGFDFEFYRYSAPIPDYFIAGSAIDQGANFRFRIRVIETNAEDGTGDQQGQVGGMMPLNPADDEDDFFVDNVAIMYASNPVTDIEAQAVKVIWPYAVVPASQANDVRLVARVANMGVSSAVPFMVKVNVYQGDVRNNAGAYKGREVYCQQSTISTLAGGASTEIEFTSFSPRFYAMSNSGINQFTLQAVITYPSGDSYAQNDTVTSLFELRFGDAISYFTDDAVNEVPDFAFVEGKGLNLFGMRFGGFMVPSQNPSKVSEPREWSDSPYFNYWQNSSMPWVEYVSGGSLSDERFGYPSYAGYASGQIAMKFEMSAEDTITGVRAKFAEANQAFDDISFNVYVDNNGLPGTQVDNPNLPLFARRLQAKTALGAETYTAPGEFVNYEFTQPIRLQKGTYWISIDQRGETGLELAATGQSMGMRTMLVSAETRNLGGTAGNVAVLGENGIQLMLDKRFRTPTNDATYGRVYVNNNVFAYRNILNSGAWHEFMPTSGGVAYAHLDHIGTLPAGSPTNFQFRSFTRGTWMPLFQPVFGLKTISLDPEFHPCPDLAGDTTNVAIEISSFDGYTRNGGVELSWETASETNNQSFIIERTILGSDNWTEVDMVAGAGNSVTPNIYRLRDENVVSGTSYKYRLYSVSFDGAISCQNDNVITVEYNDSRTIALEQNAPNPFSTETRIAVVVPGQQAVTLEVLDIFGKVVKTLADDRAVSGRTEFTWDGTDNSGASVADGNYLYRLTAGNEILTNKLSYIKSK